MRRSPIAVSDRLPSRREFLFACLKLLPELWVKQAGKISVVTLPVILIAEKIFPAFSGILRGSRAVRQAHYLAPVKHTQHVRQIAIAHVRQLIQRKLTIGLARAATYEREFAVAWTARIPFEVMLNFRRLPIFVNAKKTDIQIVSR